MEIASSIPNGAVYHCQGMPYGLWIAFVTFHRLTDRLTDGLRRNFVYIDDVVIHDTMLADHLVSVEELFARFQEMGLVKCKFVQARVQCLEYRVGYGYIAPPEAKVGAIRWFPGLSSNPAEVPRGSRILPPICARALDATGSLDEPLQKGKEWAWGETCEKAFTQVKTTLCEINVLRTPGRGGSCIHAA